MVHLTLLGAPRTKKNSQRIITIAGKPRIIPSKEYKAYEADCVRQLLGRWMIQGPVNVCCVYYMPTRRRVDLVNLLEATCDILVTAGILEDDNCSVIAGHNGSRVDYDKELPRTEIYIRRLDDEQLPFEP